LSPLRTFLSLQSRPVSAWDDWPSRDSCWNTIPARSCHQPSREAPKGSEVFESAREDRPYRDLPVHSEDYQEVAPSVALIVGSWSKQHRSAAPTCRSMNGTNLWPTGSNHP